MSPTMLGPLALAAVFVVILVIKRIRVLNRLAAKIKALRLAAGDTPSHQPLGPDDPRSDEIRRLYDDASRELGESGVTVLGDLLEQNSTGKIAGVTRWFLGADHSMCGWFALMPTKAGPRLSRFLFSESRTPGVFYITYSGPTSIRVALPPAYHRVEIPVERGVAAALVGHRELIAASAEAGSGLQSIATLAEAVLLLRRLRATSRAWRASQPADQLLIADLQLILGARYAQLAPAMRRRLVTD